MQKAQSQNPIQQEALPGALREVGTYYSSKIGRHGATPLGVDWSCKPTQELRFVQLLKLLDKHLAFSLTDLGCGYGALFGFMRQRMPRATFEYDGIDLSADMVDVARSLWGGQASTTFSVGSSPLRETDFCIASGIFNVKLSARANAWEDVVGRVLDRLNGASRRGFGVNFLRLLPEGAATTPELYRTSADQWAAYCASRYTVDVQVLQDYGMREFTLLCRRKN